MRQLLRSQLCWHSLSKASCAGRNPSLRISKAASLCKLRLFGKSRGADARGGRSGTGHCQFWDGGIPAEHRSFPSGPAAPLQCPQPPKTHRAGFSSAKARGRQVAFKASISLGLHRFIGCRAGPCTGQRLGGGFPCTQAVFAQRSAAGSGTRLAWCMEGSRVGCDRIEPGCLPELLPACSCQAAYSAAGSLRASGDDFGVRQMMRMLSCPWEAVRGRCLESQHLCCFAVIHTCGCSP